MDTEERLISGVENIELMPKTKHLCWIYEREEELADVVEPFLLSSLSRGKQCLVAVTEATWNLLLERLLKSKPDIDSFLENKQLVVVPPENLLFNDGPFDGDVIMHRFKAAIKNATERGFKGVAFVTDPSTLLDKAADEDWAKLEFLADYECFSKNCTMLCLYDARLLSGNLLALLIKAHPVIGMGSSLAMNPFYAGGNFGKPV